MTLESSWGLKSPSFAGNMGSVYKGMKQGLPLGLKIMFGVTDLLGICSMVHMRIQDK